MDKRSWPWKRKSSEKTASTTDANKCSDQGDQAKTKNVQISAESYVHLSEMESQVKVLNEKLSAAQSEITAKDALVKQHTRVAEEAIAGWEKAEAEAAELKNQLESVTLLKLTAEDRASHLDDALKECTEEIRIVKEACEQTLHDTIFAKTQQWEAIKSELEDKIFFFEQELLKNSAENASLSRSLQERSSMLVKISDEKSQAEAEIEVLRSGIKSCEKEINSLKYEVHVVTKELEIRNEEKNMSVRLAETANKQHLEDVKKISKLEAECQRLRGLVKKKLPGPAALAQMKLEVESLGYEYGDTRSRRLSAKGSGQYLASPPKFSLQEMYQCQKENEFLTARLLATEEEMKMLTEALSKRSNELQVTRTFCAKTASKLRSAEAHVSAMDRLNSSNKTSTDISLEGPLSHHRSNPSLTSVSEVGIDEEGSCSGSCSTAFMSELSQFKENNMNNGGKDRSKHLELMDDFLEMERLARFANECSETIASSQADTGVMNNEVSKDAVQSDMDLSPKQPNNTLIGNKEQSVKSTDEILYSEVKSRITSLFDDKSLAMDVEKLFENIRQIELDLEDKFTSRPTSGYTNVDASCGNASSEQGQNLKGIEEVADKVSTDGSLKSAISQIHDIVVPLCKEAVEIQGRSSDDHGLQGKITEFSTSINKVLGDEINVDDFIFALSHLLSVTRDVRFSMLNKGSEGEGTFNDCIDKLTLLEKRIAQHEPSKSRLSGECGISSPSSSDRANPHGVTSPGFERQIASQNFYQDYEQIKQEKDHIEMELVRCTETSERSKLQLVEMEQQLAELKSQLAACHKSNGLADTQLRCMAESYKSLESRTQALETELNLFRSKAEALDHELQEERRKHQDALEKIKDLREHLERDMSCPVCSVQADADLEKAKQDSEIAAAAEKLAECQETILLLGRQLKAMQPPTETGPSSANKLQTNDYLSQDESKAATRSLQSMINSTQPDQTSTDNDDTASVIQITGEDDSSLDGFNSQFIPSDMESVPPAHGSGSKRPKSRSRSTSSSSLSSMLNEKQNRGLSRFFSRA